MHAPNIQISVKKNPILKILTTTILCGCIASAREILHQSAEKEKEEPAVSPSVLSISTDDRQKAQIRSKKLATIFPKLK